MADAPDQTSVGGEPLFRFREDEAHDAPAVTLDAFLDGQTDAVAVRLEAGEDRIKRLGVYEVEIVTGKGLEPVRRTVEVVPETD